MMTKTPGKILVYKIQRISYFLLYPATSYTVDTQIIHNQPITDSALLFIHLKQSTSTLNSTTTYFFIAHFNHH